MYSCGIYESKWHVRRLRRNFINVRYLAEVLCRMFPLFPLGEILKLLINLIWLGLASTTCKTFLPGKFIPTHCFRRLLFFDFFRYYNCTNSRTIHCSFTLVLVPHILREDGARYISSGRMSPWTTSCSYTTFVLVIGVIPWYLYLIS